MATLNIIILLISLFCGMALDCGYCVAQTKVTALYEVGEGSIALTTQTIQATKAGRPAPLILVDNQYVYRALWQSKKSQSFNLP